jgi:hypothetical protein
MTNDKDKEDPVGFKNDGLISDIKIIMGLVVIFSFVNLFPTTLFVFFLGFVVGLWSFRKNQEHFIPILDYLQVDDNLRLLVKFSLKVYNAFKNITLKWLNSPEGL